MDLDTYITQFFTAEWPRLVDFARRLGHKDPEELAAQSFYNSFKAWRNIPTDQWQKKLSNPFGYVARTMRREQYESWGRKERQALADEDGAALEFEESEPQSVGSDLDTRSVWNEIWTSLDDREREVVGLFRDGHAIGDVIDTIGNNAHNIFYRAIKRMKEDHQKLKRWRQEGVGDGTYGGGVLDLTVLDEAGDARVLRAVAMNTHVDEDGFVCGALDLSAESGVGLARGARYGCLGVRLDDEGWLASAPFGLAWPKPDRMELSAFVGGTWAGPIDAGRLSIRLFCEPDGE